MNSRRETINCQKNSELSTSQTKRAILYSSLHFGEHPLRAYIHIMQTHARRRERAQTSLSVSLSRSRISVVAQATKRANHCLRAGALRKLSLSLCLACVIYTIRAARIINPRRAHMRARASTVTRTTCCCLSLYNIACPIDLRPSLSVFDGAGRRRDTRAQIRSLRAAAAAASLSIPQAALSCMNLLSRGDCGKKISRNLRLVWSFSHVWLACWCFFRGREVSSFWASWPSASA